MLFIASASDSCASGLRAPIDIAAVSKRLNSSFAGSTSSMLIASSPRVERQQVAQRGRWTFVNQFRVLLIIAVFAALHGLLQGAHHVRVVGMIFAAVHIFQQTALGPVAYAPAEARFDRFSRSCWKSSKLAPPMRLTTPWKQSSETSRCRPTASNSFEQR